MPRTPAPPKAIPASVATRQPRQKPTKAEFTAYKREQANLARGAKVARLAAVSQALTAAATIGDTGGGTGTSVGGSGNPNSLTRTWQHMVLYYNRVIPELGGLSMRIGNCLSRIDLKLGKADPDGTVHDAFDGADPVTGIDAQMAEWGAEIIRGLRAEKGGQAELLRRYGQEMFLVGEMFLVDRQTPRGLVTDALSILELAQDGKNSSTGEPQYKRIMGDGNKPQPLDPGVRPVRIHRPDPSFGHLASSSIQSCLTILEELDILTRLVRGAALSGIALSGILGLPDELDDPADDAAPDDVEAMHPLVTDIIREGVRAVEDPSSPAAFLPRIIQAPGADLHNIVHISTTSAAAEHVVQRAEAIMRLGHGADAPPEWIVGNAGSTFHNAGIITEDGFRIYIRPSIELFCESVTQEILWPQLALRMGLSPQQVKANGYPPEILQTVVHYDASMLITHPDKTRDIIDAFRFDKSQSVVKISELRAAIELDPGEQVDVKEQKMRIDATRLINIKETIAAPAADAAVAVEDADKAVTPGESEGSKLIGRQAQAAAQAPPDAPIAATQQAASQPTGAVTAAAAPPVLSVQVQAMGELVIERIAERMGAAVRAKLPRDSMEAALVEHVDNGAVCAIVGPEAVARALGRTDPGSAEIASFARQVTKMAARAGYPYPGVLAEAMGKMVAQVARDRLYGGEGLLSPALCDPLLTTVG